MVNGKNNNVEMDYTVETGNRFAVLGVNEQTTENDKNTAPEKVPPIVITSRVEYAKFIDEVKKIVPSDKFGIKYLKNTIKIFAKDTDSYNKIKTELDKDKNIEFFTHTKKEEKTKKIVFKGPPNLDKEEIIQEINGKGIKAKDCVQLKGKNGMSHSYLITVPKTTNLKEVRNIKAVSHAIIKWEHYAKKQTYTQCYRCQQFGHGSTNCYRKPKCVKCAEEHITKECQLQKTATSKAKCVNCTGEHTANYTKCPKLLEYLQSNQTQKAKKTPNIITRKSPVQDNISYSQIAAGSQPQENPPKNDMDDFRALTQEIKELNEAHNLKNILRLVRTLKQEFSKCKNDMEKAMVMINLI